MTPERAAEVLRYKKLAGPDDWDAAREIGADALEFQAWLLGKSESLSPRIREVYASWHCSDEDMGLEDFARAEWKKERKG